MTGTDSARPVALLVTPVLPMPGGSGRALRAWDWLTELAREHDVHVLLCDVSPVAAPIPPGYPARVHHLSKALAPTRGIGRRLGKLNPLMALLSRKVVADWVSPAPSFASAIDDLGRHIGGRKVARAVVFRLYLWDIGRAVAARFGVAADLDMDDLESATRLSIAGACWRTGRRNEALHSMLTALQYWLVERSVPANCRTLWTAAADDVARVPRRFAQVSCRPNRLPLPEAPRPQARPSRLLFVGTLNYPPNEEAVRFLVASLLPALKAGRRDGGAGDAPWRLTIVGRHATKSLDAILRGRSDLDYVPDADDLTPWYAEAVAVLVPLWAGGGTKLKTLEAFAYGRPVISTVHGVRGLGAEASRHFLQADNADEFVAAIRRLESEPELAGRIAANGHALFRESFCVG